MAGCQNPGVPLGAKMFRCVFFAAGRIDFWRISSCVNLVMILTVARCGAYPGRICENKRQRRGPDSVGDEGSGAHSGA